MLRAASVHRRSHFILIGLLAAAIAGCATSIDRNPLANADYGPLSEPLSAAAAQADFAQWLDWTMATHPDLSYSTDLGDLASRRRAIEAGFRDGASRREVWAAMATLNPIFDDAHVGLRLPENGFEAYTANGGAAFAAPIEVTKEGLFIADDVDAGSAFAAGDRVVTVNGVRMDDFLAWITPRLRGESDAIRRLIIERRFAMAFWTYAGGAEAYLVETVSQNGLRGRTEYDAARDVRRPEATEPFSLAFHDDIALLNIASFNRDLQNEFQSFAKNAFGEIAAAGVARLVIDLRDNGGGAHDVSDILMAYLTDVPHAATSSITARITPQNQALIPGSKVGDVVTVPFADEITPPADLTNRFAGDVVIVIGPQTYSQAIAFAATAQDLKIARLAGAPTAGRANQTAQVQKRTLANTNFVGQSPIYIMTRASGEKGARALTPDLFFDGALPAELSRLFDALMRK